MFLLQLRQLVWKNYVIRTRSKFRVITELVWPLILFVILAWVRTKGLKDYESECFLEEKALPSTGSLTFLRSMLCTFSNNCYDEPQNASGFIANQFQELSYEETRVLITDLTAVFTKRINDDEVTSGSKAVIDIASGFALFLRVTNGGPLPNVSIPLQSILNQEQFRRFINNKNNGTAATNDPLLYASLLSSVLQLPPLETLINFRNSTSFTFCNTSFLKPWINASESTLHILSDSLCKSNPTEILKLFNVSSILAQTNVLAQKLLGQPLHLEDWKKLGGMFGSLVNDIRTLDSLQEIFQKIAKTTIGKTAQHIWSLRKSKDNSLPSLMSIFNSTASLICGRNISANSRANTKALVRAEKSGFRMSKGSSEPISPQSSDLSEACTNLFYALRNNTGTRIVLSLFYPFIRGKLIYAPNLPAFNRIIENVNVTFQELRKVQNFSKVWSQEISPALKGFLNQIEVPGTIVNISQFINTTLPQLDDLISSMLQNLTTQISAIKIAVVQIDLIADLLNTYIDCYEFDKFEAYETEEAAVARGMDLMNDNKLWAVVIFEDGSNITNPGSDGVPTHIKYKIRMDSSKVDSTKRIKDFFETPMPRTNPTTDMKYFTSGYIFLQDKIEQAIIQLHSNRTQLPGMYMQQFPSPCYVYDTFFMAIAQLFPLFMILSFVYTCAMIVKSVVHEKERRLKETMRTMGLGNAVHWVAWMIDSMSFMFIACILLSIILVFGKVLENSNFLLVFIFVFSFSLATICFSFLISTFFSRANLAAACGGFIFFACFLPYNFLNLDNQDYSLSVLISSSLLSDVAFGIGCYYFASYEQTGAGAHFSNFAISPKDGDSYSLLGCILMMLGDSVIYMILTWYIEAVFPGQYGIPRKWYFMFQRSYWFSYQKKQSSRITNGANGETNHSDLIERESSGSLQVGVGIRNLNKTYSNGKVAVSDLSLDFYEDQITSFLGHNGAGKTTTISILTGLFPPSSGTATINGLDIRYQMDEIRQQLGLCPQHNVLFDKLTVEEHLRFYANLKTGEQIESRKEIDKMIEDLGLMHRKNHLSSQLSGGMKRKLSIGAAFIGNSKTVILDEPTAGVDPYSRRSIWDILLKYKTGRTIILTTHFMDEADLLGDRIAIISQGQLKCCGSSLFLKQKLGSGYYVTLVKKEESIYPLTENSTELVNSRSIPRSEELDHETNFNGNTNNSRAPSLETTQMDRITELLKRYVTNCFMVQNVGTDLVFCLPELNEHGTAQRDRFTSLFHDLESNMNQLGLDSYGVSDTTLEEIFLKVADDPSEPNENQSSHEPPQNELATPGHVCVTSQQKVGPKEYLYDQIPQREEDGSDAYTLVSTEKITGRKLIVQQFFALYTKRFCNSKRNLKGLFCEVILPALFIIINQLTTMSLNPTLAQPPLTLSPWLYGESNSVFYSNKNPLGIWPKKYVDNVINGTGLGIKCMNDAPLGKMKCSDSGFFTNPTASVGAYDDMRCDCDLGVPACPANFTEGEVPIYQGVTLDKFYDMSDKDISLWIIRTYREHKKKRFGGYEFGVNNPLSNLNVSLVAQDIQNLALASRLEQLMKLNTTSAIMNQENVTRLLGTLDNIKVWFDNKAWASSVSYLNAINNVILRASIPVTKNQKDYGITAINHPMNYSSSELQEKIMRQVGVSVLHAISVIFSMSFVPASFVIFLVEERVSKAKHLQFVSGVKPITFWIASYTWDLFNYLIPCILVLIIFVAFDQQAYIGIRNIGGMVILLLLYGLSATPLMYPASLVFDVPSSAFVGLACGNLFIGVITTISSFVLQLFDDETLKFVGSILNEVYLIFPHYCLGRGMIDMASTYFTSQQLQLIGLDYQRSIFEWNYLGRYFVSMIIQAVVFFSFTVLLHYQIVPESVIQFFQKINLPPLEVEDEDVARERMRVDLDNEMKDELRLIRLTKIYDRQKQPAVDRLSFGLRKGECFGLLGINGAGKSTTFKMLTGDETITSGNAFVGGYSVLSKLRKAQQNLGYCPQEDALLPLLTGTEHLRLFARLRGVPKRHMDKIVNDNLKKLSLLPYKNRCAGTYSGGNKRKLSTAISLIGNPSVVFLDEPSSGMDPRARRSLWGAIIDAVKDSRSVLLTSHSMEECQVLCTRLAIMVNGTLRCLGSAQHLKNKFGDGYMVNVRCELETVGEVMHCVQSAIPEAQLREKRSRQLIWHVPPNTLPISTLFEKMEAARRTSSMVDYSITQTTLDDVFVRFARLQREVVEEELSDQAGEELHNLALHNGSGGYIPTNNDSPGPANSVL